MYREVLAPYLVWKSLNPPSVCQKSLLRVLSEGKGRQRLFHQHHVPIAQLRKASLLSSPFTRPDSGHIPSTAQTGKQNSLYPKSWGYWACIYGAKASVEKVSSVWEPHCATRLNCGQRYKPSQIKLHPHSHSVNCLRDSQVLCCRGSPGFPDLLSAHSPLLAFPQTKVLPD